MKKTRIFWAEALRLCGKSQFLFPIAALFLSPTPSLAGSITITGKPELNIQQMVDTVKLSGSIVLENKGDEAAVDVFPELQLGSWEWIGQPVTLEPGKEHSWQIDDTSLSAELLRCSPEECGDLMLPSTGALPLFTRFHYKDQQGYPFSAPQISLLRIGGISEGQRKALQLPGLHARLFFLKEDEPLNGTLEVKNFSEQEIDFLFRIFTARELRVEAPLKSAKIASGEKKEFPIQLYNLAALEGSTYGVYAVLQWPVEGLRTALISTATVPIKNSDTMSPNYVQLAIFALAIGLLVMVVNSVRKREKEKA